MTDAPCYGESPPANGVLEVADLGDFRHFAAVHLIYRLSVNPTLLPAGTMQRPVEVVYHPKTNGPTTVSWQVSWQSMPEDYLDRVGTAEQIVEPDGLTEWAAIGMMVLLARGLGAGMVTRVSPVGSRADYWIESDSGSLLVEVSGVREDTDGSRTTSRFRDKVNRLLERNDDGYVAVTTFCHGASRSVHSQLQYVRQVSGASP